MWCGLFGIWDWSLENLAKDVEFAIEFVKVARAFFELEELGLKLSGLKLRACGWSQILGQKFDTARKFRGKLGS